MGCIGLFLLGFFCLLDYHNKQLLQRLPKAELYIGRALSIIEAEQYNRNRIDRYVELKLSKIGTLIVKKEESIKTKNIISDNMEISKWCHHIAEKIKQQELG